MTAPIAVIGGGLTGLAAAITLAERGAPCTLFEAAPRLGGRTGSWYHRPTGMLLDHGPHLLLGCYHHLLGLLARAGARHHIRWQRSLTLPLWAADRGHFTLAPTPWLPLQLALPVAVARLPGHDGQSSAALMRLALAQPTAGEGVDQWLRRLRAPSPLTRDLLEPLCLGSMNEGIATADGGSFATVLKQAFSSHRNARIGWFHPSLAEGLIAPLAAYARRLGVTILTGCRVRALQAGTIVTNKGKHGSFATTILALPLAARNRLLRIDARPETRAISNLHLWFDRPLALPHPFIGGIGTRGQWFFDIDAMQGRGTQSLRHYCIVISDSPPSSPDLEQGLLHELEQLTSSPLPAPAMHKMVRVRHATHPVRDWKAIPSREHLIDACEQPTPGGLPATMERAVIAGYAAAITALSGSKP